MGEINKEVLNRLKKLRNDQEKINEDIAYCVSQIDLATDRIRNGQLRNDYPLILAMATEVANQNTKLQSATQNAIAIRGDIQHLLANNPEIVKMEDEANKRGGSYRSPYRGGVDISRRSTKTPASANRIKPAKKTAKKRTGTRK